MGSESFRNYIFDLYGTLIDIRTDENDPRLWGLMAGFYNSYGCRWGKKSLRRTFWRYDAEEREKASKAAGLEHPEIKLERVFARLLFECPDYHCNGPAVCGRGMDELRHEYRKGDKGHVIDMVAGSEWAYATSNLFRAGSRKYFRPYANAAGTLAGLRERGRRIYLLSNAQRIFTMPEIEASGLLPFFDGVYISSDYDMKKPQKEFLELLLRNERLDPGGTVMVGNEIGSDALVAIRAGIRSIILNTSGISKKKACRQVKEIMEAEKADPGLRPVLIQSGDIGEIAG